MHVNTFSTQDRKVCLFSDKIEKINVFETILLFSSPMEFVPYVCLNSYTCQFVRKRL